MQRQCARPGCSSVAAATFTFDSRACTVWLDVPSADGARAGELCQRHARTLTPPQGWRLEDRRPSAAPDPQVARHPQVAPKPQVAPHPSPAPASADPTLFTEPTLHDLLTASTPLLARAFEAAGPV